VLATQQTDPVFEEHVVIGNIRMTIKGGLTFIFGLESVYNKKEMS
jgi:hypothetical protein